MAKRQRIRQGQRVPRPQEDSAELDRLGLVRQVGQFEAGTGVAHGPGAVVVAIAVALLIVPTKRALTAVVGRLRQPR
jgi:hypothetical protein